jgi:hypothetical protein
MATNLSVSRRMPFSIEGIPAALDDPAETIGFQKSIKSR